ncbi:AraC family transcriptional regulator [Nocardia vulneris]|uniref:AraC family transcriptional regulator n=1 Tax=Nocardia vulneris TaxID=1141657 RepID=UPI00068B7A5D|nr:AraC family transcriptional regulator [Nocardia vulneris]
MAVTAKASSLRGYAALVDELGGDGGRLLERFGIDRATMDDADALVSAEALGWALEVAAAEFDCPDFGLRLAARQDGSEFGFLTVAVMNSATVGEALRQLCRYLHIQHAGLVLELVPDPEQQAGIIGLHLGDPAESGGLTQGIDFAVAVLHTTLRRARHGDYGLRSVRLPHPAPRDPDRYLAFFGVTTSFGHDTTVLRIAADALAQPVLGSDRCVRALAVDYLNRNFPQPERTMSARVRVAIESLAMTATIGAVAQRLTVHERTLQRALAAEGTTFSRLLDEARRDATYRLLSETDFAMARITALVGLQEPSALTRAARRWFGAPPQHVRNMARALRDDTSRPPGVAQG